MYSYWTDAMMQNYHQQLKLPLSRRSTNDLTGENKYRTRKTQG